MPCDQGDVVTSHEAHKVVWEGDVCLQERNWAKASVDKPLMKELYKIWFAAFVTAVNPVFDYSQTADTLKGDKVNRHQIIKK